MNKFYLSFGQKYPWRDGWVLVQAKNYESAKVEVVRIFDDKWANLLSEGDFDPSFYPQGQIGLTLKAPTVQNILTTTTTSR